jgi:hypothetical protein
MEFDFLSFVLGIVVGLSIAYSIVRVLGRILYNKLVDDGVIKSVAEETAQKERIEMKVSKLGDIYYAHRTDTDDFICQGADLAELKRKFADRFPGHDGSMVGVSAETHAELLKQKQELTKTA